MGNGPLGQLAKLGSYCAGDGVAKAECGSCAARICYPAAGSRLTFFPKQYTPYHTRTASNT